MTTHVIDITKAGWNFIEVTDKLNIGLSDNLLDDTSEPPDLIAHHVLDVDGNPVLVDSSGDFIAGSAFTYRLYSNALEAWGPEQLTQVRFLLDRADYVYSGYPIHNDAPTASPLVFELERGTFNYTGYEVADLLEIPEQPEPTPLPVPLPPTFNTDCNHTDRIADIFLRARDTLNDHDKDRWSDATLLRNLKQGIEDIAIQTSLFKNSAAIPLNNGQEIYDLPCNLLRIKHCTYDWEPIDLVSSGWMDANRPRDWRYETTSGDITKVVFDEVKRRQLRVYPRPFGDFGVLYDDTDSVYGVTVGISDYDFANEYGVVSNLADPDISAESPEAIYGVLASIGEAEALVIYYTECPPLPETVEDDIPLDPCFDTILKHYVVAMALRNDLDTQNRAMSNEELVFYQRGLDEIEDLADTDSVSATSFESHYNPMG